MKLYIIIIASLLFPQCLLNSQCLECEYQDGLIWVLINEEKNVKANGTLEIEDSRILSILENYKATELIPVFPDSRKDLLKRVFKIKFQGSTQELVNELQAGNNVYFEEIIKRPKETKIAAYDPTDYTWQAHGGEWQWHLSHLEADLAWDITKGDADIIVASLDTWFDINHPDLEYKISPHYDPYDNTPYTTDGNKNNHGTTVTSFIAAHTDGGGQLSGMGFNCMMIAYQGWDGDYIERAHHASLNLNADVLTSSAGIWDCRSATLTDPIEEAAVDEIIENGTIIVMPAGNGPTGANCRLSGDTIDSPWFPLHPVYNSDIIIVSSIGIDNKHYYYDDTYDYREETHSHYAEVDICAPGYEVMGALCTESNPWPYFRGCIGTSFAAPIVAGVCALMKSIDPCISPAEAQTIIKSTADPITDASSYSGLIGAGRINAFEAVKLTGTVNIENETFTSTQSYSAGYAINLEDITINSSASLSFNARGEIVIDGSFEAQSGADFQINIDETAQNSCN